MDFAQLDLKSASERASWVHLSHKGEPLFNDEGKPCRLHIRGMAARAVMDAFKRIERIEVARRDRLSRAADKDVDAVLAKSQVQTDEAMRELVLAAVTEWENITYDGKPMPFNSENVLTICGPGTLFFEQVRDAIVEHERLFTVAASG